MSFFFFKQKTAYEMRISDWSSDVCSSDLSWSSAIISRGAEARRTRADVVHPHRRWLADRVGLAAGARTCRGDGHVDPLGRADDEALLRPVAADARAQISGGPRRIGARARRRARLRAAGRRLLRPVAPDPRNQAFRRSDPRPARQAHQLYRGDHQGPQAARGQGQPDGFRDLTELPPCGEAMGRWQWRSR